jgi:hypothetical protein
LTFAVVTCVPIKTPQVVVFDAASAGTAKDGRITATDRVAARRRAVMRLPMDDFSDDVIR